MGNNNIIFNLQCVNSVVKNAHIAYGLEKPRAKLPEIIAVSKNQPLEKIIPLIEYGHINFAENRVQEAASKWKEPKQRYPQIKLHLIGPLQSNKVAEAVSLFDAIHTIDREKIAIAIAAELRKTGRNIQLFIQVNTGEESQKSGISPAETAKFINFCRQELKLNICGLMCIPPVNEPAALHFALLKKLAEENGLPELSMGMSGDYELATSMGATYIRVGTAIFGERSFN